MVIKDFSEPGNIQTKIYCEKHTPFTLSKELEFKKDVHSYEILNFLTAVEEYHRRYEQKLSTVNTSVSDENLTV